MKQFLLVHGKKLLAVAIAAFFLYNGMNPPDIVKELMGSPVVARPAPVLAEPAPVVDAGK